MKKIEKKSQNLFIVRVSLIYLIAFVLFPSQGKAQLHWTTELIDPDHEAKLGTNNDKPINIYTGGEKRLVIKEDGTFQISNLTGDATTLLTIDQNGNVARMVGGGGGPIVCGTGIKPWNIGGNNVIGGGSSNENLIGTCNNFDFILQANSKKSLFIKTNGYIGIGENNSAPASALDISDPLYGNTEHLKILGDQHGSIEATGAMNLFYNSSFTINKGSLSTTWAPSFIIDNTGKVGIGTNSPAVPLEVSQSGSGSAEIHANTKSTNPAAMWVINNSNNYGLLVDASGTGHITQNRSSQHNLINFKYNSANTIPQQVWIGNTIPVSPHTDFNFAVAGKILAQSIYVTAIVSWADFVFNENYNLKTLAEVEAYYKKNKHLQDVPSEEEVKAQGINTAEMDAILLRKIEELTLYMVDLNKKIIDLQKENENLKKQ